MDDIFDIDSFVSKIPTIIVSQYENELVEALQDISPPLAKKTIDGFHETKDDESRLSVPHSGDKFPDEFASFVGQCKTLMDAVWTIKNRAPIKDFLESIPPKKQEHLEIGIASKKRKKRRRRKKSDKARRSKNFPKKVKYDKNVEYHKKCCSKSWIQIQNSIKMRQAVHRLQDHREKYDQETANWNEAEINLKKIFAKYIAKEWKRRSRNCDLTIEAIGFDMSWPDTYGLKSVKDKQSIIIY